MAEYPAASELTPSDELPRRPVPDVAGRDLGRLPDPSPFSVAGASMRPAAERVAKRLDPCPGPSCYGEGETCYLHDLPELEGGPEAVLDPTNPKDRIGDTKPQMHLVPAALNIEVARVMADGARKYGPYNWREHPVRMTVYLSAIERHEAALKDGENLTRDSGVKHLAAIAASCAILLDAEATGNLIDDRPIHGPAGDLLEEYTEQAS